MSDPIVPEVSNSDKPRIRYHRIEPLIRHTDAWLHLADGVLEVGDYAYLGQVRGTGPDFMVAGFLVANTYAYPAPTDWQAAVRATSTEGGDDDPRPPTWAAACGQHLAFGALCLPPTEVVA